MNYNFIRKYARRKFFREEEAEDFAQYAATIILQGRKAKLKHLYCDYLREQIKDHRTIYYKPASHSQLDEDKVGTVDPSINQREDDESFMYAINSSDLSMEERSSIILRYKYDVSLMDIGSMLGITESGACRVIARALKRLRFIYLKLQE